MLPRSSAALTPARTQSGAVLVVGLIFLVILTLIGTTAIRTASMEERMAGNNRDRNLAFQAAESALRAGEDHLRNNALKEVDFNDDPVSSTPGPNPGLVPQIKPTAARPDDEAGRVGYWRGYNWNVHSRQYGTDIDSTTERPRYAIEVMGAVQPGSVKFGVEPEPNTYRITARGVGSSGGAVVYLQSTYIKL